MAKRKASNNKVKPKLTKIESTKKEPITTRAIWHIVIGILALVAIVVIIILAIPK